MKPNIFLTGFMGTGKTTVGKKIADLTGMKFHDLDRLIEETAGLSISEIFKEKGEPWFRRLESKLLIEISEKKNIVLATGGGVVLNPVNRNKMKSSGVVVALTASLETIWERLKEDTYRPLLNGENPRKLMEELYKQRASIYSDAHVIVSVDGKSPLLLAKEILHIIDEKNKY